MRYLVFDTETTGLPTSKDSAHVARNIWPHLVSISWVIIDSKNIVKKQSYIIKPEWSIPEESTRIHGITYEQALHDGVDLSIVMKEFMNEKYDILVAHNINFDYNVLIQAIQWDLGWEFVPIEKRICTMEIAKNLCKIPFPNGRGYKYPKLSELYQFLFHKKPDILKLHTSVYDVELLAECITNSNLLIM